ncbi:uncharacterized protein LOC108164685 isoform X6 [Drosophila miranda]|uniref:uncharacterized protein LOC108164685 isoform X6 n=1 Tax=Drosophila miranda TaxID=7229 RepID=UPI0007E7B089|nr:uncharacterized protein LOC108164685 isoform X6 [Drosophila miranda]
MDTPWQLQVLLQMLLSWTLVANGHREFPFLSLSTGHTSTPHSVPSDAGKFVILPKVVGGYSITIEQVPFQVSVRRRSMHERTYGLGLICGGALISQRVACSAAHCFAVWKQHVQPGEVLRAEAVRVSGGQHTNRPSRQEHQGVPGATDHRSQRLQCQHAGVRHRPDLPERLRIVVVEDHSSHSAGHQCAARGHHLPDQRLGWANRGRCSRRRYPS